MTTSYHVVVGLPYEESACPMATTKEPESPGGKGHPPHPCACGMWTFSHRVPVKGFSRLDVQGMEDVGMADPPPVKSSVANHLHPAGKRGPSVKNRLHETKAVFRSRSNETPVVSPSGKQKDLRCQLGIRKGLETALRVSLSQPFRMIPFSLPRGKGEGI
ncbi:hypothetical protein G5714_020138 [Onychostoma macrolepis]|uniref:Uncharacterized protein n=1 Tax=Onychostoma macrolepis TaxID=369639 RepID=A0A7J6C2A4_9TELE|nr:hypothetical protein G5714_020138 [Onychostoma macrolepis]